MRLHPARRDGLSLLEVLVSLAIFLMALVALTYLVNSSSNLAAEGQHRSRAAQLARSKMNELAAGALPLESQPDASFEDEPNFRWSAEVGEGAATGLFNVTVTVTYRPDDPYPTRVSMSRVILDPKVTGSTQDVPAMPDESGNDAGSDTGSGSGSSGSGGSSAPASGGGAGGASGGGAKSGGSSPASGGASGGGAKSGGSGSPGMGGGAAGGGAKSGGGTGGGTAGGARGAKGK